jgi:glycerol kinase
LNNAIVWLDKRTDKVVHEFQEKYSKDEQENLRQRCGLPVNTYFSAVKMRWLM